MMGERLKRTRQCRHCPWKVSTDPHEIPHGYDVDKHAALSCTIARPESFYPTRSGTGMRVMACHEHPVGEEVFCVGWLMNQLGSGNNIALRLAMRNCENIRDVKLDGPQHERFEDTLPEDA